MASRLREMNLKSLPVLAASLLLITPISHADDRSILGREGSGRPTNTVVGALFGAATGAAVGQATGGKDGWWIGTLVGSAVGGTVGNVIPTEGGYSSRPYSPYRPYPSYRTTYSRPCPSPVVYTDVEEVIIEEPVVVRPRPIIHRPATADAPYGFVRGDGTIRSPWSEFSLSLGGLSPGQIVYDAHTGQPFRIP